MERSKNFEYLSLLKIHRGKKVNIDIPNTVNSSYTKVQCDNCGKGIRSNDGYGLRKVFCRKNNTWRNLAMKPTNEAYFHN